MASLSLFYKINCKTKRTINFASNLILQFQSLEASAIRRPVRRALPVVAVQLEGVALINLTVLSLALVG